MLSVFYDLLFIHCQFDYVICYRRMTTTQNVGTLNLSYVSVTRPARGVLTQDEFVFIVVIVRIVLKPGLSSLRLSTLQP